MSKNSFAFPPFASFGEIAKSSFDHENKQTLSHTLNAILPETRINRKDLGYIFNESWLNLKHFWGDHSMFNID